MRKRKVAFVIELFLLPVNMPEDKDKESPNQVTFNFTVVDMHRIFPFLQIKLFSKTYFLF